MAIVSKEITGLESGTAYDASVTARGDGVTYADSDASLILSFNTLNKLQTPLHFELDETNGVHNKTTNAITFRWQEEELARSYAIEYQAGVQEAQTVTISSYQTKTINSQLYGYYELTGLSSGTTYSVKLKRLSQSEQDEESEFTEPISATTKQPIPLDPPSNFDMRDTKLIVRWNDHASATSYVCKALLNGSVVETQTVSNSPAEFTQLTEGNSYSFKLQAIASPSDNSYVDSAEVTSNVVLYDVSNLAAPEIFRVADATDSTIALEWSAVDGATGYSLMFRADGGEYESLTNFEQTGSLYTRTVINLDPYKLYEFKLVALGNGDTIQDSLPTVISYRTLATQLPVVIGFDYAYDMEGSNRIFHTTSSSIEWKWEMGTFASDEEAHTRRYAIEIKPTDGQSVLLDQIEYTTHVNQSTNYYSGYFTTTGLAQGTEYQARIRSLAIDETEISSDWSDWKTCYTRTPLATPANATFLMRVSDLKIDWDAVANAATYNATAKSQQNVAVEAVTPSVPAAVFTALTIGETYNFEIFAVPKSTDNQYCNSEKLVLNDVLYEVSRLPLPETYRYDSTDNSLTIEWSEVEHADSYALKYRKGSSGAFINVANYSQYSSGEKEGLYYATLSSLEYATTYEIQLQAIGDGDSYLDSEVGALNAMTGRAPAVQLATPSDFGIQTKDEDGLDADYLSYDFVRLMWSPVANAVGYRVRYKKSTAANWEEPITNYSIYAAGFNIDKCYLEIHSLDSLTNYTFDIIAIGDNVDYLNSATTSIVATTDRAPAVKLDTPENFASVAYSSNFYVVSWSSVANASGYRIRYKKSSEQSWNSQPITEFTESNGTCEATISNLEANTEYDFELTAVGNSLDYTDSDPTTITRSTPKIVSQLTLRSGVSIVSSTLTSMVVAWQPPISGTPTGYKIFYRVIGSSDGTTVQESSFPVYESGSYAGYFYTTLDNSSVSNEEFEFYLTALGDNDTTIDSEPKRTTGYFAQTLTAPETFQVKDISESSATLEWSSASNATGYRLRYRAGSGAWTSLTEHNRVRAAIDWNNTITNLRANTTYECELTALGNGTNLLDSAPLTLSFTTLIDSNLEPTTLVAAIVNGGFFCQWEPVDGANSYVLAYFDVQGDESSIFASTRINGTETYWQTDALIVDADQQGYLAIYPSVQSTNGSATNERKPWSNFIQVRDASAVYELLPPRNVNVVGTTTSVISLEWEPVLAATSYVVKCGTKEVVTQTPFADVTSLLADTEYSIQVKSRSTYSFFTRDESDYGAAITARTAQRNLEKLEAPNIRLASKSESSLVINWELVENASGYKLFYSPVGSSNPATRIEEYELVGGKAQIAITGLAANTSYVVEVLAVGDNVTYQDSDRARLTLTTDQAPATPLSSPSGLVCVDKTRNTISIEWNEVQGASGYVISYGSKTVAVTGTSALLTGLSGGRTYAIKVKAIGDGLVYSDSEYTDAIRVETDADPIPTKERATRLGYIRRGRLASVKPGEVIPKGTAMKQGALVGVINHTRNDEDEYGALEFDGIYNAPLADGASFALGDLVCIDEDGNAAASGVKFGYAIEATNSKSKRVKVRLVPWLDTLR